MQLPEHLAHYHNPLPPPPINPSAPARPQRADVQESTQPVVPDFAADLPMHVTSCGPCPVSAHPYNATSCPVLVHVGAQNLG